ncbi:uncharacterized protein LOC130629174 [Hydractinia symbiolongicarpus]|uniref:uncharacterized protein LOC130629174 n=1 Tax=Hydractinia symbiolongicarpus TaxID=13093 RepID=UPI00254C038E|nr:uncharacterized protein LOC130629174 [Hydractinia symbiolongicarpus]
MISLDASSTNTTNPKKRKPPASRASPRKKCRETQEPFPEPQQDPVIEPEIEESIDWKAKYHELLQENNLLKQQLKLSQEQLKLSQSLKFRFIDHVMGSDKMKKCVNTILHFQRILSH